MNRKSKRKWDGFIRIKAYMSALIDSYNQNDNVSESLFRQRVSHSYEKCRGDFVGAKQLLPYLDIAVRYYKMNGSTDVFLDMIEQLISSADLFIKMMMRERAMNIIAARNIIKNGGLHILMIE